MRYRPFRYGCLPALLSAALLGLAGCGAPSHGDVSGKVVYRGKALSQGQVSFLPRSGVPICAGIAPDGAYVARGVPLGEAIVTVTSRPAGYLDPATRGQIARDQALARSPGKLPPDVFGVPSNQADTVLPREFASSTSSKLRCVVDRQDTAFDIILK